MSHSTKLITILGPTACGKTALATLLASRIGGQIISADSRQLYRGMDIGTGKDLSEYIVDGKPIVHHLIDIVDVGYKYNLYEYCRDFDKAFSSIVAMGYTPILCGGTGLYIEAVLNGYKMVEVPVNMPLRDSLHNKSLDELRQILSQYKSLHNTTDTATVKRAIRAIEIADYYARHGISHIEPQNRINSPIFGIDIDRDTRRRRITARLKARLDEGMIDEVKHLLQSGITPDDLIYYGLEYKYITNYVLGKITFDEMFETLLVAIHQFAKRQMTWFRGMERRGFTINWLPFDMDNNEKVEHILQIVESTNPYI